VPRLLVPALLAATLAAPALAAPEPGPVETALIQAANDFRAENGIRVLARDSRLSAGARRFAEYLARTGAFSHTADGRDPADRVQAEGYDYCEVAENIAYVVDSSGVTQDRLVQRLMSGWEASPGHRRNLLNPNVTETGVGVARAPGGELKYLAVQEFGRPASARYSFRIENRSDEVVGYVLEGEHRRLAAHTTVVHSPCTPVEVAFDSAVTAGSRRFAPAPGVTYVLSPASKGVQIEVQQRPRSSGRLDED
jgi:uncharacterized protein YkwD